MIAQDLIPSVAEDDGDSDCCNMGSPTATSAGSALYTRSPGSENPFGETANVATHHALNIGASHTGHVCYEVRGTADGLRRYLLDASSLQLLVLSSAAPSALQSKINVSGAAAQRLCGCCQDAEEVEVAVGRVAIPLIALAEAGADEGASALRTIQLPTMHATCTIISFCLSRDMPGLDTHNNHALPFDEGPNASRRIINTWSTSCYDDPQASFPYSMGWTSR